MAGRRRVRGSLCVFHYCVNSGKQAERPRELTWILADKKVASEKGLLLGEWLISSRREGDHLTARLYQFSLSVVSDSFQPHGLHHSRPPCPSRTPGAYSNSCPLSRWCHPTILSSVVPFSSPFNPLSQHQGLFKWVSSSHQVAKVLEFQLQHQSFQWIFRTDFH